MKLQQVNQAVILAGGYGRRMLPLTAGRPKPMIPIHSRPFLERLIEWVREAGIGRVTLLTGWKAEQISAHFGNGSNFGIQIDYATAPPDVETASRVSRAAHLLDPKFLLLYGDIFCPIDLGHAEAQWIDSGLPAQITLFDNADGYSRPNAGWEDGLLTAYDAQRQAHGLRGVDIGHMFFRREVIDGLHNQDTTIAQATARSLLHRRAIGAFVTRHRYYGPSSPVRLAETLRFFTGGPTIILDRDGVLNEKRPPAQYVTKWGEWRWLPGALDGLKAFRHAGWRVLLATNQPGVARRHLTHAALDELHARMRAEIARFGGCLHDLFTCTHGWDDGCDCRKPKPGLLFQAQREWALDLTQTYFAGDEDRDQAAAEAAGCKFLRVSESAPLGAWAAKLTQSQTATVH